MEDEAAPASPRRAAASVATDLCPVWTSWGSLGAAVRGRQRDFPRSSGGGATGPSFRAASGCPDRTQRGSRCLCRAALSRATSANAKRGSSPPSRSSSRVRPFHKPGAGCAACPRCWRSRRTAVSSSRPIEQTARSRCACNSTPTTRARDPRCSPFASESGCARPRERRAVGVVHSTSRTPAGWRACVGGGAEPLLARRVRSSKRQRHDAYAAPRRRRGRAIRSAVPSPARAAVLARANATLSELVQSAMTC